MHRHLALQPHCTHCSRHAGRPRHIASQRSASTGRSIAQSLWRFSVERRGLLGRDVLVERWRYLGRDVMLWIGCFEGHRFGGHCFGIALELFDVVL